MINEDQLEQLSLDWFLRSGWDYANGLDISPDGNAPERDDYRIVVLKDRLAESVARLNPALPSSAVEAVVHVVTHVDHPSLLQRNRELHRLYTNGVKVEYSTHDVDGHDVKETIFAQIIDLQHPDNNDLLVVNQFSVKGTNRLADRIYDIQDAVDDGATVPIYCESRQICMDLFAEIIKLCPDWAGTKITNDEGKEVGYNHEDGAIRIIMTGSATDKADIQQHVFTGRAKKRLEKRFKDPDDPLKIVIVRDMWLTGFDAPCCHTMYVDKPMSGHNLMQAIARVNRVFKDKPGGVVVDYIGIGSELKAALKTYTDAKGKGQPTLKAEEALHILHEKMDAVRGLFHGFDYSGYRDNALALLPPAANHILGLEKQNDKTGKQRFLDIMASVSKAYSLCSTLDEAQPYHLEIAFLSAVRAAIVKNTTVDQKLVQDQKNSAMKQILDNAVVSEGVVDVFSLANLDKPNIGLLSDEFLEDVRNMPLKNLAVELLEKLLRDEFRSRSARNVVQEKAYANRLIATLRKYHNRSIETAQVIEELIAMAKDFQARLKRDEELGLSGDEVAFYDALANNESAVRELGDETLKKIAVEITEKLKASTTVDWRERDSVRARLRNLVRVLLRRYKYPPDDAPAAIELVMKQAEALAEGWSNEEL